MRKGSKVNIEVLNGSAGAGIARKGATRSRIVESGEETRTKQGRREAGWR